MCDNNYIEAKTGETIVIRVTVTDQDGPVDLTSATISSSMKMGTITVSFTVFPEDLPNGMFMLVATAPSTIGTYQADIKITLNSRTLYSETFIVQVTQSITL